MTNLEAIKILEALREEFLRAGGTKKLTREFIDALTVAIVALANAPLLGNGGLK